MLGLFWVPKFIVSYEYALSLTGRASVEHLVYISSVKNIIKGIKELFFFFFFFFYFLFYFFNLIIKIGVPPSLGRFS